MKFKNHFIIFSLFIVLICCVCAVSAASDNATDTFMSQADDNEGLLIDNDEEDSVLNAQKNSQLALDENEDNLTQPVVDDGLSVNNSASSKENLTIVNYTNLVKKGSKYYFYLKDSKGNAMANKKITINYNGKTYEKTTNADGRSGIKVELSQSSASMTVTYKGDKKYNALSKTLKFYISNSFSITIGNTKLLTNGYLRVYLSGSKTSISNKSLKITVGGKKFSKQTNAEGFVVIKPKMKVGTYDVTVNCGKYVTSKKVKCIAGNVVSPLNNALPTVNGVPDVDSMPSRYVMGDGNAKYTLTKEQYQQAIKRDSYCLYLYGKMSKYTLFKTKDAPNNYHILKREKWNVIERKLNVKLVKANKYSYWPKTITASLKGKSYTYSEVRDVQNTEYTCGPTSASVCSQALRKYNSEKYFQTVTRGEGGVNIPDLKSSLDSHGFKTTYFYDVSSAVKQLSKGGVALIAFLPNHYVSVIDISPDGKKILVSNSYGAYDVGGNSRVPTDWVSVSYFKSKFAGVGLVVKLNYKLNDNTKKKVSAFYSSMGPGWTRQNVNERIINT